MAIAGEVEVADCSGEESVQDDWYGDVDVDGAFDEADYEGPAAWFLAGAVVGGECWGALREGGSS